MVLIKVRKLYRTKKDYPAAKHPSFPILLSLLSCVNVKRLASCHLGKEMDMPGSRFYKAMTLGEEQHAF